MTGAQMNEVHRALGRIEGKQDEILKNQASLSKVQEGHGKSIGILKSRQHWYAGGVSALAFGLVYFKDKFFG